MKITKPFNQNLLLVLMLATLSACSHGPSIQEFPETANASEEVSKLDADMNTALTNQLNVLSPSSFYDAQESLKEAKNSLDKQKNPKDTLHAVAQGRAYLGRANEFATLAHANIEEVALAREQAIQAGAPSTFPTDFQKTDTILKDVTSDIEKNDLRSSVENRTSLQLKYLDLELRAIKQAKLGQSRDTVTQAINEGAKEFAPRTLAVAQKSILDTDAFITANRHDVSQINNRSEETKNSTNHLLKITRDSKSGKKTSSEDTALQMEGAENKVANTEDALKNKNSQLETTQTQLDKGNSENAALNSKNQNLESEQAFNQRFEEARTEFTKNEAEVYKQGNILTIRLRGLEFPVDQAVLKSSNFPLLAKVQKVIKSFGKSSIVIEGHTDSKGGPLLNDKLSSERAQAVRQYLLSNNNGEEIHIKAIGYGYQKPLATNKTASGRAQNRRVDVLIHAETEAESSSNTIAD